MDPETHTFIDTLRTVNLSEKEKAFRRTALLQKMRAGSARAVPSPWSLLLYIRHAEIALLALVIVGGYGGTISIVAADSLPGDTLYSVKTRVTEPLVGYVTATTPLEQATFETTLLEKRLAEAEKLNGKLDANPVLKKEVQDRVRAQSVKAKSRVARVEPSTLPEAAPTAMSMKMSMPFQEATSSVKSFAVNAQMAESSLETTSDDNEKGKPKRALKGVYEKHKDILERLELESESERD